MLDKVKTILEERPSKHGEFTENSRATWEIMRALQGERNWATMSDQHKHSLYMIAHKMARIACGDPAEADHWDDIAGYATLVADRIRNPVTPYDGSHVYSALAVAWGVPHSEAKARVQQIMRQQQGQRSEATATMAKDLSGRPTSALEAFGRSQTLPKATNVPQPPQRPGAGTPEDGGHHADASAEELAEELRRDLEEEINRNPI